MILGICIYIYSNATTMDCTYLHIIYIYIYVEYMVEAQTMWNGKHAKVRCVSLMTSPRLWTVEQSVILSSPKDNGWTAKAMLNPLLHSAPIDNAMHAPRVPKWSSTGLVVSTLGSISWSSPSRSSTSMHLEWSHWSWSGHAWSWNETIHLRLREPPKIPIEK